MLLKMFAHIDFVPDDATVRGMNLIDKMSQWEVECESWSEGSSTTGGGTNTITVRNESVGSSKKASSTPIATAERR